MDNFDVIAETKEPKELGVEELGGEELGGEELEELGGEMKTTNIENYVKQVQLFKRTTCGSVIA
jgi:hypothetical protein